MNMKKMIALCAAAAAVKLMKPIRAYAWFKDTHRDITRKALALLEKDNKPKQFAFFKEYEDELIDGCTEPDDSGDCDQGSGRHYYSYCNPKGKELEATAGYYRNRHGGFSKSCRTMLEENYTSALCLYKSGETKRAMHVLGRAIHFIEDMSCTVHSSNTRYMGRPSNIHYAFEKNINTICKNFTAERFDKRIQKNYEGDSFEAAANKLIKASSRFIGTISTLDPKAFSEAAGTMLPIAQQNVMALMLKFYEDINSDNGNCVVSDKAYTIRNEATGAVLTVTKRGVVLDGPDKEKEQKLLFKIYSLGAFGLQTADTGFVNKKCSGFDYLKAGSEPALFRLAALGKRRFRITTGGTEFKKVLTCSRNGSLDIDTFDPEDPAQIWIIS